MRRPGVIRTYAFLPHDLHIKISVISPISHPIPQKRRAALLQLDLRRNATRCVPIIAGAERNFKCFLLVERTSPGFAAFKIFAPTGKCSLNNDSI